jgi:hypothetical protein
MTPEPTESPAARDPDAAEIERESEAADPREEPGVAPEGRHPAAHHLQEQDPGSDDD